MEEQFSGPRPHPEERPHTQDPHTSGRVNQGATLGGLLGLHGYLEATLRSGEESLHLMLPPGYLTWNLGDR